MSRRFAVVHEALADFDLATELADRVLCEAISWLDEDLLVHQRTWLGEAAGGRRLTWTAIKQLAAEAGIRVHGHFDGEPALPDAAAARRAIFFLREAFPDLHAIVLIRDQDDEPDRRGGLEQARRQDHGGLAIVVGLAIVERECWVISGYEPRDDEELARLDTERTRLGIDPRTRSHELTACKDDRALRSPKRVLRELSGGDHDRECSCWRETALDTLRERGAENGLSDYLNEVRERLAPSSDIPPETLGGQDLLYIPRLVGLPYFVFAGNSASSARLTSTTLTSGSPSIASGRKAFPSSIRFTLCRTSSSPSPVSFTRAATTSFSW